MIIITSTISSLAITLGIMGAEPMFLIGIFFAFWALDEIVNVD